MWAEVEKTHFILSHPGQNFAFQSIFYLYKIPNGIKKLK
jgi:hypothetical protein